jgi:hypothetical protein
MLLLGPPREAPCKSNRPWIHKGSPCLNHQVTVGSATGSPLQEQPIKDKQANLFFARRKRGGLWSPKAQHYLNLQARPSQRKATGKDPKPPHSLQVLAGFVSSDSLARRPARLGAETCLLLNLLVGSHLSCPAPRLASAVTRTPLLQTPCIRKLCYTQCPAPDAPDSGTQQSQDPDHAWMQQCTHMGQAAQGHESAQWGTSQLLPSTQDRHQHCFPPMETSAVAVCASRPGPDSTGVQRCTHRAVRTHEATPTRKTGNSTVSPREASTVAACASRPGPGSTWMQRCTHRGNKRCRSLRQQARA